MATRHSDEDGSDIFWPGYVDAVTNLVLNLLFLLTVMTVAVFMFALELGRSSKIKVENPPDVATKPAEQVVSKATSDPVQENIALKREIQRLNEMLAQRVSNNGKPDGSEKTIVSTSSMPKPLNGFGKTHSATSGMSKPLNGLDKTLASDSEIIVRFKDEAIALTPEERERLLETLKPVVARRETTIYVEVPAGFSEAKRMGFYRAMAVRNLLIEMKMPKENINVSVVEGKNKANSSLVKVR